MYSDMSRRTMAFSSSNRNSARARASSVLPTPVGPRNKKRADRPIRIAQARAAAANRVRYSLERRLLADDTLAQPLFHVNELFDFAFEQPADGNASPLADDFGDLFLADFFLQHRMIFLQFRELVVARSSILFRRRRACRSGFRPRAKARPRARSAALRSFRRSISSFCLRMRPMASFSVCQWAFKAIRLLAQSAEFLFDLGQPFAGVRVGFLPHVPGARFRAA